MAKSGRRLGGFVVAVLMLASPREGAAIDLVGSTAEATVAQVTIVHKRHLRSESATILDVIRQASERSETFRALVAIIEASNGIVYVNEGQCQYGVRACLVSVTPAGDSNRILNVRVDTGKRDADLVRSIGHELYHATEVLSNPLVMTNRAMQQMYRRIGRVTSGVFETDAAIDAGGAVHREFTNSMAQAGPAR